MYWLLLVVAGLLEIVWALCLKQSAGFTKLLPSVMGVTFALTSFVLLTLALKVLPVGIAYAIWVGIGAFGVAIFGMIFFNEPMTPPRLVCLALILIGAAGLKLFDG